MDNHEQPTTIVSSEDSRPEVSVVCVDQRTRRNIIETGRNALSGLVHTSFEPIEDDELTKVIIPYHQ